MVKYRMMGALEGGDFNSLFSEVLDHQVAAYVKGDFLSNFLYILIIFQRQIPKDDLSKLNFRW